MTTTVIANGNTYTDDDNPTTGMGAGGFRVRLLPMLSDVMHDTNLAMTSAQSSASAAAASAVSALAAPGTNSTSTTSLSISSGLGPRSFVTQTGKAYVQGSYVLMASAANLARWLFGQITSYNSGTGAMIVEVTKLQGTGSAADWIISLSSPNAKDPGGADSGHDTTLTATSDKYWAYNSSATVPEPEVNFSGLSTSVTGPSVFTLANRTTDNGLDLAVSFGSALRGFLAPDAAARVDAYSGVFDSSDLSPYGSDIRSQLTFSSVVAGTAGVWTKVIPLAQGTGYLVLVYGASLHAVVYSNVNGWGTPLLIRAGLSTAGGEATVVACAINDGTDNVLVSSCPDNSTAMQSIILAINGAAATVSLGTLVATTLATAAVRLVDLRTVPNSLGNFSFVLAAMGSSTALQNYGIVILATALTMTIGAVRTDTTTAGFGAICQTGLVNDVYMVCVSSATVLTVKAVSVNPTTGVQTLGSSTTTTVSSASNIYVREIDFDGLALVFLNVTPKIAKVSLSGSVPTFSAVSPLTTLITTSNTYGASAYDSSNSAISVAVSGTDASGRFLTEITRWTLVPSLTAAPTGNATISMSQAHSVVWVKKGSTGGLEDIWQLAGATELVMANAQSGSGLPNTLRLGTLGTYAQVLSAPEANYPRFARARTTLVGARHVLAAGDGSKPPMDYQPLSGYAHALSAPLVASNLSFSNLIPDNLPNVLDTWVATGPAPSLNLVIQRLRTA